MRLVKTGPSLKEGVERWVAARHHRAVVARLRRFRRQLEQDMKPEPWVTLEAPMPLLLADVCNALGLSEEERATVLGVEGVLALADMLEDRIRPVPRPWLSRSERQAKALAYVREHGMLDMSTYRQICPYWSDETLRLDLASLVRQGLLTKNGRKKGTRYTTA